MNYRQWKKNYKKMHGFNPPIEVDRRKQAKMLRKALRCICETDWLHWSQLSRKLVDICEQMVSIAKKLCENQSKNLEGNQNE